jgi:hypothetical protein
MVLPSLCDVWNLETIGNVAEDSKKRKRKHHKPKLCSFTSGASFSSGGGDRKSRYVELHLLCFLVFINAVLTLALFSFVLFHIC